MMQRPSKEERRVALRNETQSNIDDKDSGGFTGKGALNFSGHDNIERYKPSKGKNMIDIIPYVVTTTNHPKGVAPGYDSYNLDYWVHYKVGPMEDTYICLKNTFKKPCPICQEIKELMNRDDYDEDVVKALRPKRRVLYNVIDLEEGDDTIQLFEVSHFLFEKELLEEANYPKESGGEVITFADLEDGRSIVFRAKEEAQGKVKYLKYKSFSFEDRDPYDESILEEAYPLDTFLVVPTYDEVRNAFLGLTNGDIQECEKDEEEEPINTRRRRRQKSQKVVSSEKEENEDPIVEEKEEKEKKTIKKKSSSKTKGKESKTKKTKIKEEKIKEDSPPFDEDIVPGEACPNGHIFGIDNEAADGCDDCDVDLWNKCADAKEVFLEKKNNKG